MYRWECKTCGDVKRTRKQPKAMATKRFCLPCSDKKGSLVRREPPDELKSHMLLVGDRFLDLCDVAEDFWTLPALCKARSFFEDAPQSPRLSFEKTTRIEGTQGYSTAVGVRIEYRPDDSAPEVLLCLLHELVHLSLDGEREEEHGLLFQKVLADCAEEAFGVRIAPCAEEGYGTDDRIAWALIQRVERWDFTVTKRGVLHVAATEGLLLWKDATIWPLKKDSKEWLLRYSETLLWSVPQPI